MHAIMTDEDIMGAEKMREKRRRSGRNRSPSSGRKWRVAWRRRIG